MNIRLFIVILFLITFSGLLCAQSNYKISGVVKDEQTLEPINYVAVGVLSERDSIVHGTAITKADGKFEIGSIPAGNYFLKIVFVGYRSYTKSSLVISSVNPVIDLGTIKLKPSITLNEVTIETKQERVKQSGDTVQFNAGAYKTNPDATAEDLVKKMPGITSENGSIKVNGEDVKQVLVDGKPFFGDDPNMAIKNLPAEVIDKIQVYDKSSDQAQLTGFDDGKGNKTINIKTKPGRNNGKFGKVYGGYGTNDRYIVGGNLNVFKGDRRISIIELSNNINQQNFNMQDLLGVTGSSGGGQGRGGMGGGGRSGGGMGGGGQGGASSNFLVGQQAGVSTTHSVGFNYSDTWGTKVKVTGSYFFNYTDNTNNSSLSREYILGKQFGLRYNQNSLAGSTNNNHRVNLRFEYTIDTMNSIIFTPKFNVQQNNSTSQLTGYNIFSDTLIQNNTGNNNTGYNAGYTFSSGLLYSHKFKKRGRTFSIDAPTDVNNKTGNSTIYSHAQNHFQVDSVLTDLHANQYTNGATQAVNLVYTEPINKKGQIQFNYNTSYSKNNTDKKTNDHDVVSSEYTRLDTALSNKFQNTYITYLAGAGYRFNGTKASLMATLNAQYAQLSGNQVYPTTFAVNKTFENVLPQFMYNYKFSDTKNLRVNYRTSTNVPSISQLQNVINNSNQLLLSTGNPNLKQSYDHNLSIRFGKTNTVKATGIFLFVNGTYTQNYIGNSTIIPTTDTVLNSSIVLTKGRQLTLPVNMQGYWNARSFVTFSFPVKKIKSNFNLNTGFTYNSTPALVNNVINLANNYNFSQGVVISSNISEKIDFNLSYTGNYSIVKNSLQTQSNNNYFNQTTSFKFNWIFLKGFVFNTSLNHTLYTGLSQSYNQSFLLWTSSFGYKFFKNRSLEVKISVFDMLNQNNSVSRSVTETYIEDSRSQVLNRYYMLMATYTFRKFKKPPENMAPPKPPMPLMPPPGQ